MDIQVPLNKLKFGHDDGAGINARVAGRLDGIEALAANLHARGQIENLVVKRCDGDFYSVSNGNRRLAAFHQIYGADSSQPINVTVREVDETGAFEDSLTTAVTARQLHPVDQYEAFARLDERGKTHEEIAHQYGMTEKEVRQALALGRLSPKIREAWRQGEMKAEAAQAFTLAIDPKTQNKVFAKLSKEDTLYPHYIRSEIGVKSSREMVELLNIVGPELYRARGGTVIEDLFNEFHSVSDEALLKALSVELLDKRCDALIDEGWSWAKPASDLPDSAHHWPQKAIPEKKWVYAEGEKQHLDDLKSKLKSIEQSDEYDLDESEALEKQIADLETIVRARSYTPDQRKKLGCIVDFEGGAIEVLYGVDRPAERATDEKREPLPAGVKAKGGAAAGADAPKPQTVISNAMVERLHQQLLRATLKALQTEAPASPLAGALAAIVASQIKPDRPSWMPQEVSSKLEGVRALISPAVMNDAVAKSFEPKDFFGGAPKPVLLKVITEAINADESRKLADKTKAEIGKWALANVVKTGWLPKELRTPHYAGPGSAGFKKPAAAMPGGAAKLPPDRLAALIAKSQPAKKKVAPKKAAKKKTAKKKSKR